ncbi:hypothetical protein PCANC_16171 [Puccinia coronata f. sp. avenae]|uniref:Uncharacterized protein n=1 Tax=Puccinia coronata f. sp. avenae TaxID=200324 RepID=A0A2N5SZ65_9BASI|nr:hypothetical protein PCANC_16171 [Puccinia coronata f. sp. avenae]
MASRRFTNFFNEDQLAKVPGLRALNGRVDRVVYYCTLESRQVTLMIWALTLEQDVESRAPDGRRGSEALIVLAGGEAEGVVKGAAASNDVGTTGEEVAGAAAAVLEGEAANNPNDTDSAPHQGATEREITKVIEDMKNVNMPLTVIIKDSGLLDELTKEEKAILLAAGDSGKNQPLVEALEASEQEKVLVQQVLESLEREEWEGDNLFSSKYLEALHALNTAILNHEARAKMPQTPEALLAFNFHAVNQAIAAREEHIGAIQKRIDSARQTIERAQQCNVVAKEKIEEECCCLFDIFGEAQQMAAAEDHLWRAMWDAKEAFLRQILRNNNNEDLIKEVALEGENCDTCIRKIARENGEISPRNAHLVAKTLQPNVDPAPPVGPGLAAAEAEAGTPTSPLLGLGVIATGEGITSGQAQEPGQAESLTKQARLD